MSAYSTRSRSTSRHATALPSDEFRIEFEGEVLPPPVTRLAGDGGAVPEESFETRLQRTQEELLHLRQQALLAERQEEDLKELARKEREYSKGRAEVHEKLARTLVTLERTGAETQRALENLLQARDDLARHHRVVSSLMIEDWSAPGVGEQADHALAVINDARLDYDRTLMRLGDLLPQPGAAATSPAAATTPSQDFRYWLRSGFAFTLPLLILGALALVLVLVF